MKMANKSGPGFLLTTKFYNSADCADIFVPYKEDPEGNASMQPEVMAVNKQENARTKQFFARKFTPTSSMRRLSIPEKT